MPKKKTVKDNGKDKVVALLLAWFLGGFGVQHFYLGNKRAGWLSVIFFWTFIPSIVSFIHFIKIALMSKEDFNSKYPAK